MDTRRGASGSAGRCSMQWSVSADSVASLYVATRAPVSRIATILWPSASGSTFGSPMPGSMAHDIEAGGAMGKLVRDRIPEIIEASGRRALTRVLDDAEYDTALL